MNNIYIMNCIVELLIALLMLSFVNLIIKY